MATELVRPMQEILDLYGSFHCPPLSSLSPEAARNLPTIGFVAHALTGGHLTKRALAALPELVGRIEHRAITGPGGDLLLRVYTPQTLPELLAADADGAIGPGRAGLPTLLYFHGGGWVTGDLDACDDTCRALCNQAGFLVVSASYRKAPEHPFPAATQDALCAYRWLLEHAHEVGGDPDRIAIGGESAGGNLATVTCLQARDLGIPLPIHQLLVYPVTQYGFDNESYRELGEAPANLTALDRDKMQWFWKHYLRDRADGEKPYASPLRADVHGLPAATVILAEVDPLRTEGKEYTERLRMAGITVESRTYPGVTHGFFGMKALLKEAREAQAFASKSLQDAATHAAKAA